MIDSILPLIGTFSLQFFYSYFFPIFCLGMLIIIFTLLWNFFK